MEIKIFGTVEEIAALVAATQERRASVDGEELARAIVRENRSQPGQA